MNLSNHPLLKYSGCYDVLGKYANSYNYDLKLTCSRSNLVECKKEIILNSNSFMYEKRKRRTLMFSNDKTNLKYL